MKREKRNYSKAFKEEAVRLSYQRDNIKDLADELGIAVARIYKWRTGQRNNKNELTSTSSISHQKDTLEVKGLKKAVPIFSKRDGKSINL